MNRGRPRHLALLSIIAIALVCSCDRSAQQDDPSPIPDDAQNSSALPPPADTQPAETPSTTSSDATGTIIRFENATGTGLEFTHRAGHSPEKYMPQTMGGGLVVADFNRDAAPDVLFVDSGTSLSDQKRKTKHRLFINDGQGRFTDQTDDWQLPSAGYGMGAAVGDFDNDGWTDLYLTTFGGTDRLLRNTGSSFVDVTEQSGLNPNRDWSTSAGFLDMDGDQDLDLYVVKYVDYTVANAIPCYAQGFQVYCTPVMFDPSADQLYQNNGDGTFTNVTESAGIPNYGKGLALAIGDIDRDGDADIYVANDTTANFLLINDGGGRFQDRAAHLGVGYSNFGKEEAGMGADFSDVNDDGLADIVCTNYQEETTSLYIQQPQGHFLEQSDMFGVGRTARQRLSFGIDFFDADNDGDEDLLVANGHVDTDVDKYQTGVTFGQLSTLYERGADGRLRDITGQAGEALSAKQPSRGLATADLDSDGNIDFLILNNDTTAQVARNITSGGNFVSLWLEGTDANRSAIAAVLHAKAGDRVLVREVLGASSYLSACDNRVHFGLGAASAIDELIVHWPSGTPQTLRNITAGKHYHLIQGQEPVVITPGEVVPPE